MRCLVVLAIAGCSGRSAEVSPIAHHPEPVVENLAPAPAPVLAKRELAPTFRSFELVRTAQLYKTPAVDLEKAEKVGSIRGGTRVEVRSIGPRGMGCDRWIEIEPRGWTCENLLVPSTRPPSKTKQPSLTDDKPGERLVAGVYGSVVKGAVGYRSIEDLRAGNGVTISAQTTLRGAATITVDGVRYWQSTTGLLVASSQVGYIAPSSFKGELIDPDFDVLPAWVRRRDDPRKPALVTTAAGKRVRELPYHAVVTILEADGKRVRIGDDQWIARKDLRVATRTEPPEGTGPNERWFDVDTEEQVLVAYEGKQPVYATLVSTGKWGHWTPSVIARIVTKYEATTMNSDEGEAYSVADVPWTMFYDGNYALHTAYWHDTFGGPRSHGCVNLSPRDAKLLYRWSSPDIPAGWTSVYADVDVPGSLVRVRTPGFVPVVRGYAAKLLATN
jgi:hypothetical protein